MKKHQIKYRYLSFLIFLLSPCFLMADFNQYGTQFITNIKYQSSINNYVWSITQSSRNTIIVASRTGVLEYNSEEWNIIETPDIALCLLSSNTDDIIYACGRNHIGFLKQNKFGQYSYISLQGSNTDGIFTDIYETDSTVYFYSSHKLLYYNLNDTVLSSLKCINEDTTLIGSFLHNNKLYLNILNNGIFRVEKDSLIKTSEFDKLINLPVAFSCKYSTDSTLIGTQNGELFILGSDSIKPFAIEDKEYLQKGTISDGQLYSDSQIAISFKNLGLIVIDKYTGKTIDIIDNENGLPDDFVSALYTGKDHALWIAHSLGLSRVDVTLPIKNYSSYFGIEGSIITSNLWNKKLYVATTNGVYVLDSISYYDTQEAYKKIPIVSSILPAEYTIQAETKETPEENIKQINEENIDEDKKNNKWSLFKRLFNKEENTDNSEQKNIVENKKPENKIEIEYHQPKQKKSTSTRVRQKYEYFHYQQFILKSKNFGFSLVGELKDRCYKLIPIENQLLAVTNSELYSIDINKNVSKIYSGTNIIDVVLSKTNSNKLYIIDNDGIYAGIWKNDNWNFSLKTKRDINFYITSLAEISEHVLLISLNNELVKADLKKGEITEIPLMNPYSESVLIKEVDENVYVLVGETIYLAGDNGETLTKVDLGNNASMAFAFLKQPNEFFIKTSGNYYKYFGAKDISEKAISALKIFNNIKDINIDDENNIWIINNLDEIYRLNTSDFNNYYLPCKVYLDKIITSDGMPLSEEGFNLKYSQNSLTFSFFSPSSLKLNSNQYQYIIKGLMNEWSEWQTNSKFTIPYLPEGNYTLKFRVKNFLGEVSETKSISFKVLPPFWKTIYFYALVIISLILTIYIWQKIRLRRLIIEKENLRQKVKERTEELQIKNKSITDSITYAGKIQNALLPPKEKLDSLFSDYFIYYKPKDIISGDFYLTAERKRYTVVIAADCTGHGVPGAFMSMLGIAYINEVLSKADTDISASDILNTLREKLITLLHQHNKDSRDGMDMVVLLFDKTKNKLQYAGAHNPLYRIVLKDHALNEDESKLVSNENDNFYLLQYRANRFQVGNSKQSHVDFTNHIIDYKDDDRFYIFSDGYADQFGGEDERKFMYGRFRKLILSIAHNPMREQKITLMKEMKEWKNGYPQTDDILVFGLRL